MPKDYSQSAGTEPKRPEFVVDAHVLAARPLAQALYLVATPIGHLGDVTLRALEVLAAAAVIACEDTRVTRKLLGHYGISTPLTRYDDHSGPEDRRRLLDRVASGEAVALVSDAGTPLISDPGYRLVADAKAAGLPVVPIPGASAVIAALAASGLPSDRFLFAGFLSAREGERARAVAELRTVRATLVLYEAPHRLVETLEALAEGLGDRPAAVARELTKLYEEVRPGSLSALALHYAAEPPRGEIVIVIAPPAEAEPPSGTELDALLSQALARLSVKDATAEVAASTGTPRREVYARALALSRRDDA